MHGGMWDTDLDYMDLNWEQMQPTKGLKRERMQPAKVSLVRTLAHLFVCVKLVLVGMLSADLFVCMKLVFVSMLSAELFVCMKLVLVGMFSADLFVCMKLVSVSMLSAHLFVCMKLVLVSMVSADLTERGIVSRYPHRLSGMVQAHLFPRYTGTLQKLPRLMVGCPGQKPAF